MSQAVDTIQVVVKNQYEVQADSADLIFSVKGSNWFTGKAAFEKAKELNRFVQDLKTAGIEQDQLELRNVRVEVSSGMFSRASSAHYIIKVCCRQLDRLDDVLTAATSQKNATLDSVQWGYPDQFAQDLSRLDLLLSQANEKAHRMAKVLGVEILGVHSLVEQSRDLEQNHDSGGLGGYSPKAGVSMARGRVDTGMEVTHRKTLTTQITVHYRVGSKPSVEFTS